MVRRGGSNRYLAPELDAGDPEEFCITSASDIFSLSMTLFAVWSRKHPFAEKKDDRKAALAICNGQRPRRPSVSIGLTPKMEQEFWDLLTDMWAHKPSRRPLSKDIQERLESILGPLSEPRDIVSLAPAPLQGFNTYALENPFSTFQGELALRLRSDEPRGKMPVMPPGQIRRIRTSSFFTRRPSVNRKSTTYSYTLLASCDY